MAPNEEAQGHQMEVPLSMLKGLGAGNAWKHVHDFVVPLRGGRRAHLPDAIAGCIQTMLEVPQRSWDQTGQALVSGFGGGTGHVHASDGPEYTYHLTLSRDNKALASVHRHGISVFRMDRNGEWVEQEKVLLDTAGSQAARRRAQATSHHFGAAHAPQPGDTVTDTEEVHSDGSADDSPPSLPQGTIPHRLEWVGSGSERLAMSSHSIRGGPQSALVANKGSRISLWHVPAGPGPAYGGKRGRHGCRKRKRDGADEFTVFQPERSAAASEHSVRRYWEFPQDSPPSTLAVLPGLHAAEEDLDSYVAVCGYRDGTIRMWGLDSRRPQGCLFKWSLMDAPCRPLDAGVRIWDARSRSFVTQDIPLKGASLTQIPDGAGGMKTVLMVLLRFSRQLLRSTLNTGSSSSTFCIAEPEASSMHTTRTARQGVVWALDLGGAAAKAGAISSDAASDAESEEEKMDLGLGRKREASYAISSIRRMSCLHESYGKTLKLAGVDASRPQRRPWAISAGEGPRRNLLVHNVETGALLHELMGHTNTVHTLSIEGQWLASGSKDGTVRLWRWQLGECVRVLYAGEQRFPLFNYPLSLRDLEEVPDSTSRALLQMSMAYRPPTIIAAVVGKGGEFVAGGGHELDVSGKTVIRIWSGKRKKTRHALASAEGAAVAVPAPADAESPVRTRVRA